MASGHLLLYNFTGLEQGVARVAEKPTSSTPSSSMPKISWLPTATGQTRSGMPWTATWPGGRPRRARPLVQDTLTPEGDEGLYDFSVPVIVDNRRWGTARVGLSQRRMQSEIRQTRFELGVLTAHHHRGRRGGRRPGGAPDRATRPASGRWGDGHLARRAEPAYRADDPGRDRAAGRSPSTTWRPSSPSNGTRSKPLTPSCGSASRSWPISRATRTTSSPR